MGLLCISTKCGDVQNSYLCCGERGLFRYGGLFLIEEGEGRSVGMQWIVGVSYIAMEVNRQIVYTYLRKSRLIAACLGVQSR